MLTFDVSEYTKAIEDVADKLNGLKDGRYPIATYKILDALETGIREDEYIPYRDPHIKTPRNSQHLQDNVTVSDEYIWWKNTYAGEKYEDPNVSKKFHVNASPEWDKAYLAQHGKDFYEGVLDIIMNEVFKD